MARWAHSRRFVTLLHTLKVPYVTQSLGIALTGLSSQPQHPDLGHRRHCPGPARGVRPDRGHPIIPKAVGNVFATFSDLFRPVPQLRDPAHHHRSGDPAIADLGRGAGKWLGITTALAYTSTLFAGFLTFLVCAATFPRLLAGTSLTDVAKPEGALSSYFTVEMPPPVEVMTALLLSFIFGIGLSLVPRGVLRKGSIEFRAIITRLIERMIIPCCRCTSSASSSTSPTRAPPARS